MAEEDSFHDDDGEGIEDSLQEDDAEVCPVSSGNGSLTPPPPPHWSTIEQRRTVTDHIAKILASSSHDGTEGAGGGAEANHTLVQTDATCPYSDHPNR